ncbi:hypothetical protein BHE74_00042753 [Ensete ventricosum]|nr:hypothetical protein BHE74_00042753 [Ensete ventricosum]
MRLNHVELFYVYLLYFRNEGNEETSHGQALAGATSCDRTQPGPPARAVAHGQSEGSAPTEASPSRVAPTRKGGACGHYARRSCRLRVAAPVRPPRAPTPTTGAAAHW